METFCQMMSERRVAAQHGSDTAATRTNRVFAKQHQLQSQGAVFSMEQHQALQNAAIAVPGWQAAQTEAP